MEAIFEFIFEILIEGTVELAKSRKVPLPLRILAALLVTVLFGGVIFLLIWGGLACLGDDGIEYGSVLAVLLFVGAAGLAAAVIFQFVKALKNHHG